MLYCMNYSIEFCNAAVEQQIMSWAPGIQAAFVRIAEKIVQYGPNLGLPYTRALGGGLFEIRAKGIEGIGRALYCVTSTRRVVVLHGFIKKTQKIPRKDLDIARRRLLMVEP